MPHDSNFDYISLLFYNTGKSRGGDPTNLLCKYDVFSWGLHVLPNNQWGIWGHDGTLCSGILGINTRQNSLHISTLYLSHRPHNSIKRYYSLNLHQAWTERVWITWQAPQYVTVTAWCCHQQQVPCTNSNPAEKGQGMSSPSCSLCLSIPLIKKQIISNSSPKNRLLQYLNVTHKKFSSQNARYHKLQNILLPNLYSKPLINKVSDLRSITIRLYPEDVIDLHGHKKWSSTFHWW